jgi:hypothetical protein
MPTNCADTNLSLTIMGSAPVSATACVSNIAQGGSPSSELTAENAAFLSQDTINTATFGVLASTDGTSLSMQGIKFTATANAQNGSFAIGWTDINGSAPLNLPITLDLMVGLYGGNNGDGYLFRGVTLLAPPDNSGSGTFTITFLNPGGQIPTLSHLDLDGGNAVNTNLLLAAPEPASIAVIGVGMAALGAIKRRTRQAKA